MARSIFQGHPDHDACGTGFIVQLGKSASHEVVERALVALQRLSHRGGVDADGASGDGAGLLTQIPERFMRRIARESGIELPDIFAAGMIFLPQDGREDVRCLVEATAAQMSMQCLGWRRVPTNVSVLGPQSAATMPSIWQCFFSSNMQGDALERQLFLLRKRIESQTADTAYFCSLSSRTIVYKGLLAPWQLPVFYPDLNSHDFESSFAIFHQRFSTNTKPAWSLAQPFRFLAHNGEINTIVANRRWMHARQAEIREEFQVEEWFQLLEQNVSDSASLDNALEILVQRGFAVHAGMLALTPPASKATLQMHPEVKQFLEAAATEYEPWDGPAALIFSDGRIVGAKLDRNGLRPLRYTRTSNGFLVVGSEAGLADFEESEIIERQRLGPGEMLAADTVSGQVYCGQELLLQIAGQKAPIAHASCRFIEASPAAVEPRLSDPKKLAAALGWTEDQYRLLFLPMTDGKESVWSMGDDAAPAFLSEMRRPLWDYCKQRFAQVTNPAIDSLREAYVMSLNTRIGPGLASESPIITESQLSALLDNTSPRIIDITFDASQGVSAGLRAFERIRDEVLSDSSPNPVLLTDRAVNAERTALPVLLATVAVWQAMMDSGRFRVPLVIESGQVSDTHHLALLLTCGASAVCPYLAIQLAQEHKPDGAANYFKAITAGLLKVLARMGISTLASYRNGCIFELVGLDQPVSRQFFPDATHWAGSKSLESVLADYLHNHCLAFASSTAGMRDAGLYRYRKEGERHATSPELLRRLHAHVKKEHSSQSSAALEQLGNEREPVAVRDLLEFVLKSAANLAEVEPKARILQRFSTQAMSLGAISPEAHRTLALAMNSIGARSNTGEGGEDPALYRHDTKAINRVKQVASGRFGVTAEYLVHGEEIEIKIAQGAKPGEGGQLPGAKVSPYIARLRHAVPGMALISPPPHHDIYSIEDLAQLIYDLREVNPYARIGVKLVATAGVGIVASGVAKAGADVITISGHDGGTGAAPLTSIKNTGLPWELGLRETHRALLQTGLRQRVSLRVDGGLKFARDIAIAAMLGADEFGFGTAALLAIGCVMARQCHLNTCPVGIATQDEGLRARFAGKPEMVVAYFEAVAEELRKLLATLGSTGLSQLVGDTSRLKPRSDLPWLRDLLEPASEGAPVQRSISIASECLAHTLSQNFKKDPEQLATSYTIRNEDRSIGARLSGDIVRYKKAPFTNLPALDFEFSGAAGQSFGAFLVDDVTFRLKGEANDYVGKGLSGGVIAISAGPMASLRRDVLVGNTVLYGATSGELYVAGRAGERFAVRNSGALAVAEGTGDHGCEYMTGGVVLVLGPTGVNLGSGMTGGLLYLLEDHLREGSYHPDFVRPAACSEDEQESVRRVLLKHLELTASPLAAQLLNASSLPLRKLEPLKLPCSIEEVWQPILQRLKSSVQSESSSIPAPDLAAAQVWD